jgi:hypothetical protein
MNPDNSIERPSISKPTSPAPSNCPAGEVWEAPFERWIRLADELLREWPLASAAERGGLRPPK